MGDKDNKSLKGNKNINSSKKNILKDNQLELNDVKDLKVNKRDNPKDPLDKEKNLSRVKNKKTLNTIIENDKKRRAESIVKSYDRLLEIKNMIDDLDSSMVNEGAIGHIITLIDKELEKCTLRMEYLGSSNNTALKEEAELFSEFNKLNGELFNKVSMCMPFDSFLYAEDSDREKILIDIINNIDSSISLLDYDDLDFNTESKNIIKEKNAILSDNLIDILEEKLNVRFSDNQRISLKNDFSKIASKVNADKMDELIKECDKIKEVKNLKLVSRPSYKNFISKSELKSNDDSHKISTIRLDFVNYITLNKNEKLNAISDNLEVQLSSIKEILEEEKEEYRKKMKLMFALLLLSGATVTFNPVLAATGVIALGSAAAYMQTKVIVADNKVHKIDDEIKNIDEKTSSIVNETYEKIEETSNELMKNEEYSMVAKEYIKKKKEAKKIEEMKKKIEERMRLTIIENLDKLSETKKEKIAHKVKDKVISKKKDKELENSNNKEIDIDVQIEL